MNFEKVVIGDATLYRGDCEEAMVQMTENQFDLAIVDPPYGIGDVNQSASRKIHKKITWNNSIPSDEYFKLLPFVSKNQIIWGINYYASKVDAVGRIIHDKVANTGKQLKELSDADIASHSFGVNIKMFRYGWRGNVQGNTINWNNTGDDGRIHPTQKPISLYRWLLETYAKEGDHILDTHGGSMSSVIAAAELGFKITVYERDQEHFDNACARITEAQKQLRLF